MQHWWSPPHSEWSREKQPSQLRIGDRVTRLCGHYVPSKCQKPLNQWHSVKVQKSWVLLFKYLQTHSLTVADNHHVKAQLSPLCITNMQVQPHNSLPPRLGMWLQVSWIVTLCWASVTSYRTPAISNTAVSILPEWVITFLCMIY